MRSRSRLSLQLNSKLDHGLLQPVQFAQRQLAPWHGLGSDRTKATQKKTRGKFSNKDCAEYKKHIAFGRNWGLVFLGGEWALHPGLLSVAMPGLSPRDVDLVAAGKKRLQRAGGGPGLVGVPEHPPRALHTAFFPRSLAPNTGPPHPKLLDCFS